MHTGLDLLVLMVAVGGAWLAAAFAALAISGQDKRHNC